MSKKLSVTDYQTGHSDLVSLEKGREFENKFKRNIVGRQTHAQWEEQREIYEKYSIT